MKGVYQQSLKDCGVACLLTIIKYYKGNNTFENVRYLTKCNNNGTSALNIVNASKKLGFDCKGIKCNYEYLEKIVMPCICHIKLFNGYNHFIVLNKVNKKYVKVFDPEKGNKKLLKEEFNKIWTKNVIELIPNRKLDVIQTEKNNLLKKIIKENVYLYLFILILSFIFLCLNILNNYYFKTLLDNNNYIYILIIFVIIILLKEISNFIRNKIIMKLQYNVETYLYNNTHRKLLSLPIYYFNSRSKGDIITKFYDLEYIKDLLIQVPFTLFIDLFLIIITILILYFINSTLLKMFFLIIILYVLILEIFNKKIKNMVMINQEKNSFKNSILLENINNIYSIKNMNIENYRNNIFNKSLISYCDSVKNYEKKYNFIILMKNLVLYIGTAYIIFYGIILTKNEIILLSELILFNSLIIYIVEPLNNLFNIIPLLKNSINALKRIDEIFLIENKVKNEKIIKYDITINNLCFSYDGYKNILKNFSYYIKENEKLVVIGDSGIGKSTLFKIINSEYEIENNMIYIGSKDINLIDTSNVISYVSQDEKLFNDTLYNNIVLNNDYKEMDEILKITGINKLLYKKNINLDTLIGQEGLNLSKGERQRIILARVLLKKSKILILDEALNGIDEVEEKNILKSIKEKFNDKTIIYITHNINICNIFDQVLNFNQKEVL